MAMAVDFTAGAGLPLNSAELRFKRLHEENSAWRLDCPHAMEQVHDLFAYRFAERVPGDAPNFRGSADDHLTEQDYFPIHDDVNVVRHLRYLPTVLHKHDFFEVACLLAGSCTHHFQNHEHTMVPGDVFIIAPGTVHAISVFADDCLLINLLGRVSTFERAFATIMAAPQTLSGFFAETLYHFGHRPYLYFRTQGDAEVLDYVALAYAQSQQAGRYRNSLLVSTMTSFLLTLFQNHEDSVVVGAVDNQAGDEHIVAILRYIQDNYCTLTLQRLAEKFAYSERHMQRILRLYAQMSFSEIVAKLKMERAADLLAHTRLSVCDIAADVGYGDVSNFRHAFRRYHGIAPTPYRARVEILA